MPECDAPVWQSRARITFSKHAKEKLAERGIPEDALVTVLRAPKLKFYDVFSRATVAIGDFVQEGVKLHLVVVFRKKDGSFHVVTAYPVRDVEGEVERKVKAGRWLPI